MEQQNHQKHKKNLLISNLLITDIYCNSQLIKNTKAKTYYNRKHKTKSLQFSVSFLRSKFRDYPTISSNLTKTKSKKKINQELPTITLFKSHSNSCIIPHHKKKENKIYSYPLEAPYSQRLGNWSNPFQLFNTNNNNNKEDILNDKSIKQKAIFSYNSNRTFRDIGIGTSNEILEEDNTIIKKIKPIDLLVLSKRNKYYNSMMNKSQFCFLSNFINAKKPSLSQINNVNSDYFNRIFHLKEIQMQDSKRESNRAITQPLICKSLDENRK